MAAMDLSVDPEDIIKLYRAAPAGPETRWCPNALKCIWEAFARAIRSSYNTHGPGTNPRHHICLF